MMPPMPPEPEMPEPPPQAAPMTAPPSAVLPLSPEDLTFWRAEVERAEQLRIDTIAAWDVKGNLERYTPKTVRRDGTSAIDGRVNVGKDFSDVERKKAALFYDTPEIALIPDPGTNPLALAMHQELLNALLSSKRMDAKATVLPTIQDCLVAIQPVPTEIGYTSVSVDVPEMIPSPPEIDPFTGQAGPPGPPMPSGNMLPVIVWEEFFWRKISAAATLLPVHLQDTKYDQAPWIGYRWRKPLSQVKRQYALPEEGTPSDTAKEKPYFQPLVETRESSETMVGGVKLWYRAAYRDASVTHPDVIRELEMIDGLDQPVVHRNCPYQEIGEDGRLTANSIVGYPEHPLALRDLTDAPYVAADCTLTGPLTRELNKFRTQVIQRRDASKLHVFYDSGLVNPEMRDKMLQNDAPTMIPAEPGSLAQGKDAMMLQVPAIELGRENYMGQDIIERDRDGILGMNQNTQNPSGQGGKTATEVQTVQRNTDARFEQERQRVLQWWLAGVQKVSALVLRYGDRIAVEILGPERGQQWVQARDAGQFGRFSFETVIDSGNYVDIEARKRQDLQLYSQTAQDPSTHHEEILTRLATDFGIDPQRWIVTEKPEQKPTPPTVSISVKPEDLDPMLPSYVGTYAILTAGGMKGLPPPQPQAVQPPVEPLEPDHGGMASQAPRLNQHQLDESGDRSGPKLM